MREGGEPVVSKCQDFKVGMPVFQPFYEMKCLKWEWSGPPSSLIPTLWNILLHKQAKLRKYIQHTRTMNLKAGMPVDFKTSLCGDDQYSSLHVQVPCIDYCLLTVLIPAELLLSISEVYFRSPCPNISTTPITAMGYR